MANEIICDACKAIMKTQRIKIKEWTKGRNILESRETYKTPIGEIEIGKWAKRVEEAARADGKAELLERIKERASKLAWMQRADELEIKIYACECLLDKAYEHWEDFEVDGENKNEY